VQCFYSIRDTTLHVILERIFFFFFWYVVTLFDIYELYFLWFDIIDKSLNSLFAHKTSSLRRQKEDYFLK